MLHNRNFFPGDRYIAAGECRWIYIHPGRELIIHHGCENGTCKSDWLLCLETWLHVHPHAAFFIPTDTYVTSYVIRTAKPSLHRNSLVWTVGKGERDRMHQLMHALFLNLLHSDCVDREKEKQGMRFKLKMNDGRHLRKWNTATYRVPFGNKTNQETHRRDCCCCSPTPHLGLTSRPWRRQITGSIWFLSGKPWPYCSWQLTLVSEWV